MPEAFARTRERILCYVVAYDQDGQLVAGTPMEYHIPVAADMPPIELWIREEDRSPVNPLGVKGAGEDGIVAAGAARPGREAVTKLRLMLFRSAYNLPVTAGIEWGVFTSHGLDLEIAYTRGSLMTTEALLGGGADIGVLSADDVVYEVETHGADLFAFMGLHRGMLTLVARPSVKIPADLRGARLGVDDPASGFALVAHRILRDLGLAPGDYETVATGGHEPRARALLDGTIDVALLTAPFTEQALDHGCALLARARDHVGPYQASCGVTTRRWTTARAGTLVAYIRAYREAVRWALDPRNRDAAVAHLAREFALDARLAVRSYAALSDPDDGLFADAAIDVAGVRTVLDLRVEAKLLPSPPPDPARYYDLTYLGRAAAAG